MFSSVISGAVGGISSYLMQVEVDVSDGLPGFSMVGFMSGEVREAGARVKVALKNAGTRIPPSKITINLSPVDIRKTGVDICYPEENRDVYDELLKSGGAISEFSPGTRPVSRFFPMRNRIISALSDILLVVEARQKSGTGITVDTALEQGREVLAVPGRVTDRLSDGCNYLISQGAGVALDVEDVLDRLWKITRGSVAAPSP